MYKHFLAVMVASLFFATTAQAAFQWLLQPAVGTRLEIKFDNFEGVLGGADLGPGGSSVPVAPPGLGTFPDGVGDILQGIVTVADIHDADNPSTIFWSTATPNQNLVGYFTGYSAMTCLCPPGYSSDSELFCRGLFNLRRRLGFCSDIQSDVWGE